MKKDFEEEKDKSGGGGGGGSSSQGRKRSVTFGGATKYEFEGEDESGEFHNKDINTEGKGSPRYN